jgi:hypothetical protein
MLILWPIEPAGFVLESCTNLAAATWIPVPDAPLQIGSQLLVPIDMSESMCFYHLRFNGP